MARRSDTFDQYSEDDPSFSPPPEPYRWGEHPYAHPVPRGGMIAFGGAPGRAGGGAALPGQPAEKPGEAFEREWRASADRAERLRQQYEGTRPWTGSPQDFNDVIAPDRSGGMGPVTIAPRPTRPRRDEGYGGAAVPARPTNGNGNGLSGGAAKKVAATMGTPYL